MPRIRSLSRWHAVIELIVFSSLSCVAPVLLKRKNVEHPGRSVNLTHLWHRHLAFTIKIMSKLPHMHCLHKLQLIQRPIRIFFTDCVNQTHTPDETGDDTHLSGLLHTYFVFDAHQDSAARGCWGVFVCSWYFEYCAVEGRWCTFCSHH